MLQGDGALEAELGGVFVECRDSDGVVEWIVQPAQVRGSRRDRQIRADKTQIVTFAGAKHHAMFAEADRVRGNDRWWCGER